MQVIGKPKPTPKWLKADEEIIPSEGYLIENYPDGTSVLTLTDVQPDDIDQITFEAVNPVGTAKTVTKLHVEGIPSTIPKMAVFFQTCFNLKQFFYNNLKDFLSASMKKITDQHSKPFFLYISNIFQSFQKKNQNNSLLSTHYRIYTLIFV